MSVDPPPASCLPGLPAARAWPGSAAARAALRALIETLDADLRRQDSATMTLERWCGLHRLADPPVVRAVPAASAAPETVLPAEIRAALALAGGETLRYRRVRLVCGRHLLSEAENWYVPQRLTPAMNRLLDETQTPFGTAVRPLGCHRRTLSATLLWTPPAGDGPALRVPAHLIRHWALVAPGASLPVAAVSETYTNGILAFATG